MRSTVLTFLCALALFGCASHDQPPAGPDGSPDIPLADALAEPTPPADQAPPDGPELDRVAEATVPADAEVRDAVAELGPDAAEDASPDVPAAPDRVEPSPEVGADVVAEPGPEDAALDLAEAAAPADVPADRADAPCGMMGIACCPGRVCGSGLGCGSRATCVPCGARGQPCCWAGPGALCPSDLACRGSGLASTCECGNPGEPCCPGLSCATVPGVVNLCRTVGSRRVCG